MNKIKSIDQQLYDELFFCAQKHLQDVGIYATLPDLSAKYPFIVLGEVQVVPRQLKYITLGKMFVTVAIWGNSDDRRLVSDISETLMEVFSEELKLDSRRAKLVVSNSSKRILEDTSLSSGQVRHSLWHGILSLEFDILI